MEIDREKGNRGIHSLIYEVLVVCVRACSAAGELDVRVWFSYLKTTWTFCWANQTFTANEFRGVSPVFCPLGREDRASFLHVGCHAVRVCPAQLFGEQIFVNIGKPSREEVRP